MTLPTKLDSGNAEATRLQPVGRHSRGIVPLVDVIASGTNSVEVLPSMQLERLLLVPFASIDGHRLIGRDVVQTRSLLVLIDAYRTRPERSAAEVAWVRERLETGTRLILVWPSRSVEQALHLATSDDFEQFFDLAGDYRRLVSPSGKRVSILVDPEFGIMRRVTGDDEIFSMSSADAPADRGSDHMIDLGDVYR